MRTVHEGRTALISSATLVTLAATALAGTAGAAPPEGKGPPGTRYVVEADWPKPLPNNWILGQVGGIAVDRHDNIWIIQRARSLDNAQAGATDVAFDADGMPVLNQNGVPLDALGNPRPAGPIAECCVPAPAVMKFDREGNLLDAWGGPADPGFVGPGGRCDPAAGCQWPAGEHGIFVDHNDNVYIAGNSNSPAPGTVQSGLWEASHGWDAMVLKFSSDGTFLLNIGDPGATGPNSNDTNGAKNGTPQLWRPADMEVDPPTNILYIADGYGNHRVVAVNADTGMYLGHWGAYGQNPVNDAAADAVGPYSADRDAGVLPLHFRNPVHCVRVVGDLIYVCDRVNNRIQVFNKNHVGAACNNSAQLAGQCGFIQEAFVAADTLGNGSTWDLDTSADKDQSCLFNPDGTNQKVWILKRNTLAVMDSFGFGSHNAGGFRWVHNLAVDSRGNVYTAEVHEGKRAQKFRPLGSGKCM